jgi:hypothetical protein
MQKKSKGPKVSSPHVGKPKTKKLTKGVAGLPPDSGEEVMDPALKKTAAKKKKPATKSAY